MKVMPAPKEIEMDNGSQSELTIQRLPQGGFIVQAGYRPNDFTQ